MVSERATQTSPFEAMDVLERANERDDVVHLEVGEPDFEPPPPAVEAAMESLQAGGIGYTEARGKPALREAIAAYYRRRYDVDIDTDRIIVTPGSSPGLLLVFLSLVDPGEEVLLTDPYYACYPNFVRQAGGRVTTVPLSTDAGFQPELEAYEEALDRGTRAILVNSPANPTGAVFAEPVLAEITAMAGRVDATVIADEAYHGLAYDGQASSVLEHTDDAFVVDTFSKRFGMTGWRLGWVVAPPAYVAALNRLAQNLFICASDFAQDAGIAALDAADSFVPEVRRTYRDRRDYLVDAVSSLGIGLDYTPGGAYYLLVDVRHLGDAFSIAETLLDAGVATTPGRDFGPGAEPYLRLSYATELDQLEEAVARIRPVLETSLDP